MTRSLLRLTLAAAAAALLLASGAASAQTATADIAVSATVNKTCTISTLPVAFGAYDPAVTAQPVATGRVTVSCTKGTSWAIDLGNGGNHGLATGFASDRAMTDGGTPAKYLAYELYIDSGHATAWYTGTAGSTGVSNGKATTYPLDVFGRIQDADPNYGVYSDTVVATVTF